MAISPDGDMSKRKRSLLEVHASQLAPYFGKYREPELLGLEEDVEDAQEDVLEQQQLVEPTARPRRVTRRRVA